jgi:small subunit ribosomal protein S18
MQRKKKRERTKEERFCYFCVHNIADVEYRNTEVLQKFTSNYQKILPRKRMGACARHQRQLGQAVKRARIMALIPYTNDQK